MDKKEGLKHALGFEVGQSAYALSTAITSLESGIAKLKEHVKALKDDVDPKKSAIVLKAYEDLSNAWVGTEYHKIFPHIFELSNIEKEIAKIEQPTQ